MKSSSSSYQISRRRMLKNIGGVAALSSLSFFSLSKEIAEIYQVQQTSVERVKKIFSQNLVLDFHTHLGLWQSKNLTDVHPIGTYIGDEKLRRNIQEIIDSGCQCVYFDIISDISRTYFGRPGNKDRDFVAGEAWQEYLRQYDVMQILLKTMPLAIAHNPNDIATINQQGKLAVILATEGGHMVEDDISKLDVIYQHGFRRFQPIHYVHSKLGDSQTDAAVFNGLSKKGKEAIKRASELGMMVDVAHASFPAVQQIAAITNKPLALSHTMMRYNSKQFGDYNKKSRPRWISAEYAKLISETNGVIGTFPLKAPWGVVSSDAFIEALLAMIDVVGIDHVTWSTDLLDIARSSFLQDYKSFPLLCAKLLERGFSDEDLVKFVGGNAMRVYQQTVTSS